MDRLFSGKSTLIVDKQLADLQALRAILGNLGFSEILVASSVNMALSLLRERPVDVCFLCYELGRGEKNGLQLLMELQAEAQCPFSRCHILVVDPEKSELLLGSPGHAPDIYISKPYEKSSLSAKLGKLMRLKRTLLPVERLLDQGAWQEALVECDKLLQLYPGLHVYLQRLKGIILLRNNRAEPARGVFADLLKGRDKPWIRIGLAIAACRSGWFEQANQQLDHVISQQQICVEAFVWRARLHRLQGTPREAQALLRRAVVLQPTVALLQGDLANMAALNNETGLACDAFRSAIRYSRYSAFQHPDYYFGLVRVLMGALGGEKEEDSREAEQEAIRVLEQAQRDFLGAAVVHFRCRLLASEVYRAAGDQELGERAAQEALALFESLSPDEQALWLDQLVEGMEQTTAAERARECRQTLTRQMARLEWGRDNLRGMMEYRKGALEEARASFERAWQQQQDNASIGLNLVQALLEIGRRGKALERGALAQCEEVLYRIQFAALTPKQQQRYRGLMQRLASLTQAA